MAGATPPEQPRRKRSHRGPALSSGPVFPAPALCSLLASRFRVTALARCSSLGIALAALALLIRDSTGLPISGEGSCVSIGMQYEPLNMAGQWRTVENNWEACQARCKYIEMLGCAHFSFWPDGGCHLQSKEATQIPATGWDGDKVISGPGDCRNLPGQASSGDGDEDEEPEDEEPEMPQQESHIAQPAPSPPPSPVPPAAAPAATTTRALPPSGPPDKCPGGFHMPGYGPVAIVPTGWKSQPKSGLNVGNVDVQDNHIIVPHMDGRAYFADACTGTYNHSQYLGLNLLGKEVSYMIDLSHAGCGCNAAFYLTSMKQNTRASECYDFYCDANNVCGESCAEIDIMEANKHAFHSTLHTKFDHGGMGGGYGGGSGWNGPRDFTDDEYGPHARCVDTLKPFEVTVSFPVNNQGYMRGMHVKLSQSGKSCPLTIRVDSYDGMQELSGALSQGMTPILSYWSAKDMLWMDGVGADHRGPCARDDPSRCGSEVRMYDFKVRAIGGGHPVNVAPPAGPQPAPAAGSVADEAAATVPCAITRKEDCTSSKCCLDAGMQCYEKHQYWAACQIDCTPGVDPRDPSGHHSPWSCKKLGPRTPGDPIVTTTTTGAFSQEQDQEPLQLQRQEPATKKTSNPKAPSIPVLGEEQSYTTVTATFTTTTLPCAITRKEDCSYSQCCIDPGMQCYEKHEYWAACQIDCTPGVDPRDPAGHHRPWSCNKLGKRTPGQPLVTSTTTTFTFSNMPVELPPQREGPAAPAGDASGEDDDRQEFMDRERAGFRRCAITRKEDCRHSACCADPGMQCYEKNKYWAACEVDCVVGIDPRDKGIVRTPWTCKKIGPRTPGDPVITTTTAALLEELSDMEESALSEFEHDSVDVPAVASVRSTLVAKALLGTTIFLTLVMVLAVSRQACGRSSTMWRSYRELVPGGINESEGARPASASSAATPLTARLAGAAPHSEEDVEVAAGEAHRVL